MTALEIFRLIAVEFSAVGDETVRKWLELTAPLVSRRQFGKLYEQAVALLAAHRMKVSGAEGGQESGGGGMQLGIGETLRISSYSEGSTSVSFNNAASGLSSDSDLSLTSYGVQYLALRRMCVIPIKCSGEGML